MADRKLQYIIEMIADDSQIRKQMKGWDWADIMGTAGKSFGDMIGDEAKYGADEIKRAFKGLNVDWTQILGTKEIGQLEQALARSLQKNKIAIQDMANKKDAQGIQNTIDLMVELGKEFQQIGSNFDAGQIARSLGAFTKALQTDKISKFVTDTETLVGTFDKLFNGKALGGATQIATTINQVATGVENGAKKIQTAVSKIEVSSKDFGGLKEYRDLLSSIVQQYSDFKMPDYKSMNFDDLIKELDIVEEEWDQFEAKMRNYKNPAQIPANVAQGVWVARAKFLAISDELNTKEISAGASTQEISEQIKAADELRKQNIKGLEEVQAKVKELDNQIKTSLKDSLAKVISEQLSEIQLNLTLPSEDTFIAQINDYIAKINTMPLDKIKLGLDNTLNPISEDQIIDKASLTRNINNLTEEITQNIAKIEELKQEKLAIEEEVKKNPKDTQRSKRAKTIQEDIDKLEALNETNKELLATSDDAAVQHSLSSIMNNYNSLQKVIKNRQDAILTQTRKWRQDMIEAMKTDKNDVNIQLGFEKGLEPSLDNLYNAIQNYFMENEIELHINKEAFVAEVKDALANGGISGGTLGGGGTVNFDMSSLKSAIAEGLLAALTGDFTSLGTGTSATQSGSTPNGKKQKYMYLDPDTPYMKEMVNAVHEFAEYAQKDTAPAKKIRSFFDLKGVDLKSMVNASSMEVADMLSQLIGKYGATLIDDLNNMPTDVSKNNMVVAFRSELSELIHSQAIKQTTVDDENRRLQSIDVFKDLAQKSQMLAPFGVKSSKWKVPDVNAFDNIFSMATGNMDKTSAEYLNAFKAFAEVKSAITNEEGLDAEAQKEKVQSAIENFKSSIQETYTALFNYVNAFEMDVFVKGSQKPYRVKGYSQALKAQAASGDEFSKLQDVHIYKDISTGVLGTTGRKDELKMISGYNVKPEYIMPYPDRTDILNRDATVKDWRTYETVQADIKKIQAELEEAMAAGKKSLAATKRHQLQGLQEELKTVAPMTRWQPSDDSEIKSSQRAENAAKLLAQSATKATELAKEEAEIEKQIEAKTEQKTSLENEIAQNQKAIAKLNDNPRKLAGTRTRLANRKVALGAAKAERDAAKNNKQLIDSMDFSERDREVADINASRARYQSWQKNINKWMANPDKYGEEYDLIAEALYGQERRNAILSRNDVRTKISSTKGQIAVQDKEINRIQAEIQSQGATQERQIALERAIKQRELYVNNLKNYEQEFEKQQSIINDIEAKILGRTDADKAAFRAKFQEYTSAELQKLNTREAKLGADPRVTAEMRLSAANKTHQKAQQDYDAVASSDEGKRVIEIDQLIAKNQELETQLTAVKKQLDETRNQRNVIGKQKEASTATSALTFAPQREEVEGLIKEVDILEQDIYKAKQDANELDKKVQETMNAKGYKKPKYDVKYSKKDQAKIDKQINMSQRALYLKSVAADKVTDGQNVPDNLTASMSKAIDTLSRDRVIIKALSQNFNLDKFDSNEKLIADIKGRLDRSASGKKKLHPMIEEFYNKIISDGQETAEQWRQSMLSATTQDSDAQIKKIEKFAQNDEELVKNLAPEIESAKTHLKESLQQSVKAWTTSIKNKIDSLKSGKFSSEEEPIIRKEIDDLFALISTAESDYTSLLKDGKYLAEQSALKDQLNSKSISIDEYNKKKKEANDEITQRVISELFTDEQNAIMESRKDYSYSSFRDREIDRLTNDKTHKNYLLDNLNNQQHLIVYEEEIQKEQAELFELQKDLKDAEKEKLKLQKNNAEKTLIDQQQNKIDTTKKTISEKEDKITQLRIGQRNSALNIRQAELLKDIDIATKAGDTKAIKALETELMGVNDELVKYAQYHQRVANASLLSIFQDDLEFSEKYKNSLHEIIQLEQEEDLAKAKGDSAGVSTKRTAINTKTAELNTLVYDQLQTRQASLLQQIETLSKDGQDAQGLVDTLKIVNQELVEYELNKRRAEAIKLGGVAYKADTEVMRVYDEETRKLIESEQELAIARAKGIGVDDALSAKNKQRAKTNKNIQKAQELREGREASGGARAKALEYLAQTEKTYTTALEQRAALNRRIRAKEYQLENIENDSKYSTSGQYERHQRIIKDRLVNQYVGSDDYLKDKDSGIKAVEQQFTEYLNQTFGPEKAQEIFYEFMANQRGKGADKVDVSKLKATYGDMMGDGTYMDSARKSAEEEFKNTAEYKSLVESRQAELDNMLEAPRAALRQAYSDIEKGNQSGNVELQQKFEQIDRELAENVKFLKETTEQDYPLLKEEVDKLLSSPDFKNGTKYQDVVAEARNNLIANEQQRAQGDKKAKAYQYYTDIQSVISKPFMQETNTILQNKIDDYVRAYFEKWVSTAFTDEAFQGKIGDKAGDVVTKFQTLMDENVHNIVSKYAKSLVVENGMLGGINIREEIRSMLTGELNILEGLKPGIDSNIAHIEAQRKAAMKYGGISSGEVVDAEVLREQAELAAKLTSEKAKQRELTEEIKRLEQSGGSSEELGRLNAELDKTNQQITKLSAQVDNRENLLGILQRARTEEEAEKRLTLEEKQMWFSNKLEVAKANLESGDVSVRTQAEQQVARYTAILGDLEAKMAAEEAERRKDSSVIGRLEKIFGSKGGVSLDASGVATEATLSQILQVLNGLVGAFGGKIATNPEMEAKLAEIRAIDAELATLTDSKTNKSGTKTQTVQPDKNPNADKIINDVNEEIKKVASSELPQLIKNIFAGLKPENLGTEEDTKQRYKLYASLKRYRDENIGIKDVPVSKSDKKGRHTYAGLAEYLGVKGADKEYLYSNKVHERANEGFAKSEVVATAESEKQLENEKAKTAETAKQVENEKAETARTKTAQTVHEVSRNKIPVEDGFSRFIHATNKASAQNIVNTGLDFSKYDILESMVTDDEAQFLHQNNRTAAVLDIPQKYVQTYMRGVLTTVNKAFVKGYINAITGEFTANPDYNPDYDLTGELQAKMQELQNAEKNPPKSKRPGVASYGKKASDIQLELDRIQAFETPVKPEVIKETSSDYIMKLKEILGGINSETKGTEKSLSSVSSAMDKLKKTKGVEAFKEFKDSLLALKSGKGTLEDVTQKAQNFVDIFANYKNNSFSDLSKWFGKDVQADATSLLGIIRQIFELTSKEQALRKANKSQIDVAPVQKKSGAKKQETATAEKKEQTTVDNARVNELKAKRAQLEKDTAEYRKQSHIVWGEGSNLGGLALDSTLQEILTAIRNIQANGIKKGGGSGSGRSKPKGKTEADLIGERALKQQDIVRGLAAGRGKATDSGSALFAKYEAEVAALNTAIDNANTAKKKKQTVDINAVKTAAAKVEALTNNILRDTAEWDYRTSQSDAVWDYKLPKNQKMTQARMEAEAQKTFNKNKEQYKFLSFDGDTLTYQLTDLEGKVRNVTMVWSDFNQQIALTSDKTTNKLDPLAEKVQKLKEKFEDAKAAGYLNADDAGLTKFAAKLAEIGNAKTFKDVERLRKEAIALGDGINKTINTNKGWMVGQGAKKSADNQYNKIFGAMQAGGPEFESRMAEDSPLLMNYLDAYNKLNIAYDKYAKNHQLNDPKIQQELQQQANAVQMLGKRYLASVQAANTLSDRVEKSGTFTNARTGEVLDLGGVKPIQDTDLTNLKSTMQDFVQNGLRQANIEGVKFDSVNQRLTYNFRITKDTVAKMAVEYNEATKALYAYKLEEKRSLTGFKGFLNDLQKKGKSILSYLTYTTSIYRLISVVRQGINYVKEIDAAMTELRKVTDETEESYNKFLNTAAKTADKVGSTIKEIVSSTADWARLNI